MLFMAITSAARRADRRVLHRLLYDIYRKYINPKATGEDILRVSRYVIFGFGIFSGVLSIILQEIGLSLGFVYLADGHLRRLRHAHRLLTWDKANATGAIAGAFAARSSRSSPTGYGSHRLQRATELPGQHPHPRSELPHARR